MAVSTTAAIGHPSEAEYKRPVGDGHAVGLGPAADCPRRVTVNTHAIDNQMVFHTIKCQRLSATHSDVEAGGRTTGVCKMVKVNTGVIVVAFKLVTCRQINITWRRCRNKPVTQQPVDSHQRKVQLVNDAVVRLGQIINRFRK